MFWRILHGGAALISSGFLIAFGGAAFGLWAVPQISAGFTAAAFLGAALNCVRNAFPAALANPT